jgi:hypothetical protein
MGDFPRKCVIDTNVPATANLTTTPDRIPNGMEACVMACVKAVTHIIENGGLVIDAGDEIFSEYRKHLSLKGQPGLGDHFIKWLNDHRWKFPEEDRVIITREGNSYKELPKGIPAQVDISDRKFIAVANAHPKKPPIIEATDSKWWGWKDALRQVGIEVNFLCPVYIQGKYQKKIK